MASPFWIYVLDSTEQPPNLSRKSLKGKHHFFCWLFTIYPNTFLGWNRSPILWHPLCLWFLPKSISIFLLFFHNLSCREWIKILFKEKRIGMEVILEIHISWCFMRRKTAENIECHKCEILKKSFFFFLQILANNVDEQNNMHIFWKFILFMEKASE